MVKIREVHLIQEDQMDVEGWAQRIANKSGLSSALFPVFQQACQLAAEIEKSTQAWVPNISSLLTGLEMAEILAELGLDDESLVAAVLYRPVREGNLSLATVKKSFGSVVSGLIENVLRMAVISSRNDSNESVFGLNSERQASKVREMLVSIIDDVRVALIKLAERTCAIRALKGASEEKRCRVAREIVDVYAPLAHRLGIGHLKWELEDLAFSYLEALQYKSIAKLLAEKRRDRQTYINELRKTLTAELKRIDVQGTVSGRAKHIYSIWKKMQRKDISFSKIYDIRAVRVLVSTVADCYTLLGIVHSKWRNLSEEFDDYIANPKENGYRSLHTAVVGPKNQIVEVQIRTFEMHEEAEFGICAHWQYKDSDSSVTTEGYESKIAWLRQVLEWHDEVGSEDVKTLFKHEGSPGRIYVFTPEGHVVDLPPVSTSLDFAYRIHTQVGHRCRGCKINGHIAPLTALLHTADQVEILTGKNQSPSRDWLSTSAGYLHTVRARASVQQWFKKQSYEKNAADGKAILEKEFRQLGIKDINLDTLAEKLNKKGAEGLYATLGSGEISIEQVVGSARGQVIRSFTTMPFQAKKIQAPRFKKSPFYIHGVGDLPTRVGKCCNPVPGEEINGYVTSGRCVTIHRQDCGSLLRLKMHEPERILQASWGSAPTDVYSVPLQLMAYDRPGLLSDVTTLIDQQGLAISSLHAGETVDGIAETSISVDVQSIESTQALISKLRQIPNVIDVKRIMD